MPRGKQPRRGRYGRKSGIWNRVKQLERKIAINTEIKTCQSSGQLTISDRIDSVNKLALDLFPEMTQGSGNGQRDGRNIVVKSAILRYFYTYDLTDANGAVPVNQSNMLWRIMLLKQKGVINASFLTTADFNQDHLTEQGGFVGGANQYAQYLSPINTTAFTKKFDRRSQIAKRIDSASPTDPTGDANPSDYKHGSYRFKFGRNGRKVIFADDDDVIPQNFNPYFLTAVYMNANNTAGITAKGTLNWNITWKYTDK